MKPFSNIAIDENCAGSSFVYSLYYMNQVVADVILSHDRPYGSMPYPVKRNENMV